MFKKQKRIKVRLKHQYVNETDANGVWYCLMMMAWPIWREMIRT